MATLNVKIKQYLKIHHIRNHKDWEDVQISFIPDENIPCDPPYIKGKMDSAWIKLPKIRNDSNTTTKQDYNLYLNTTNKRQCEKLLGMKLQEMAKTLLD